MHIRASHKLLREWLALVAILAMVLGPLALASSRSLAAQERVNVAAGLAPLPICTPGDSIDGLASKTGGGACDHCLPAAGAAPTLLAFKNADSSYSQSAFPADTGPSVLLAQLKLPPATGPPSI
jgi:hypothetical protein